MKTPHKFFSAFTLIELLVVISIIGILAGLAIPAVMGGLRRGQMTQSLSNMKQLHLATQQMALDGTTTGDASLTWPGSNSFSFWATNLVPSYLSTNDFCKLLSVAGAITPQGTLPTENDNGITAYAVAEQAENNVIFLSTKNVQSMPALEADLKLLFAGQGAVVFRKGGDGAILLPKQLMANPTPATEGIVGVFTNVLE